MESSKPKGSGVSSTPTILTLQSSRGSSSSSSLLAVSTCQSLVPVPGRLFGGAVHSIALCPGLPQKRHRLLSMQCCCSPGVMSKCNSAETSCALQIWRCTPEMVTLSRKHMNTLMVTRIFFMVVCRLCHASYMYIRTAVLLQNSRVVPPEHLVASALL